MITTRPPVLICTMNSGPDVALCVASIVYYAPANTGVVVCWAGTEPDLPVTSPSVRLVEQPPGTDNYGDAFNFAVDQTDADAFVLMNDDAQLQPDTYHTLIADSVYAAGIGPVGMVGTRSNYISGNQHIARNDGRHVTPAKRISPVCAYVTRAAIDATGGFAPIDWYSDDLLSRDMRRNGYRLWISRAFTPHIGQRSTGGISEQNNRRLAREGGDWVREHRPDAAPDLGLDIGLPA